MIVYMPLHCISLYLVITVCYKMEVKECQFVYLIL